MALPRPMGNSLNSSSCRSLSSESLGCYKDDLPRMMGDRVAYSDAGMSTEVGRPSRWRGIPASDFVQHGKASVLIQIAVHSACFISCFCCDLKKYIYYKVLGLSRL